MRKLSRLNNDFDSEFKKFQRLAVAAYAFWVVFACATLGGIAFVVYKLMVHFGVL